MMIRKSIFYLFATTILMAIGEAQPSAGSLIPPDSEIRGILMQRVDEFHQTKRRFCAICCVSFCASGLVREASEYRWSSDGWATGGAPAEQGFRPTTGQLLRVQGVCKYRVGSDLFDWCAPSNRYAVDMVGTTR
jgi:hypothetical protein